MSEQLPYGMKRTCEQCKKTFFIPKTQDAEDWGWSVNNKKFCGYTCMRAYAKGKKVQIVSRT